MAVVNKSITVNIDNTNFRYTLKESEIPIYQSAESTVNAAIDKYRKAMGPKATKEEILKAALLNTIVNDLMDEEKSEETLDSLKEINQQLSSYIDSQ